MASAPILGGSKKVDLDPEVFGVPFNGPLVHEVVVAELAARRRGTASTRTRGMVRGGGAKPWRQKGTGRARAGTSRSPLWTGGGTVFGPSPRQYTVKVNRKARRAALRSALSIHAERGTVAILDADGFDAPSTKAAVALLEGRLNGRVTIVVTGEQDVAAKSFRNLDRVLVRAADEVGVADIVGAASLVLSVQALDAVTALAKKPIKSSHTGNQAVAELPQTAEAAE